MAKHNSTSLSSKLTKGTQNNLCASPSESCMHEISELLYKASRTGTEFTKNPLLSISDSKSIISSLKFELMSKWDI